jgi:tellurite resistance protein TerC
MRRVGAGATGWEKFPASWSLGIAFAILTVGVFRPPWKGRGEAPVVLGSTAKVSD